VEEVIAAGYEAIILAAAIAAGPEREASDPETILR
jgi:UDP-glucose 4-epimerase